MCQVTQSHVGSVVQVSNDCVNYYNRHLLAVDLGNPKPFVVRGSGGGAESYVYARPVITHREPSSGDVGRDVEVSADGVNWKGRRLVGFDGGNPRKFITRAGSGKGGWFWRYARIRVS